MSALRFGCGRLGVAPCSPLAAGKMFNSFNAFDLRECWLKVCDRAVQNSPLP